MADGLSDALSDAALATDLAVSAGQLLLAVRADHPDIEGSELKDLGDRSAQALLAERLGLEQVPMGSAGYKVAAVVRGQVDLYVHAGGQYEWDSAAPVAVAMAAGLHCSRIDGSPLVYNQPNPYMPDLLICRRNLAPSILELLDAHNDLFGASDEPRPGRRDS